MPSLKEMSDNMIAYIRDGNICVGERQEFGYNIHENLYICGWLSIYNGEKAKLKLYVATEGDVLYRYGISLRELKKIRLEYDIGKKIWSLVDHEDGHLKCANVAEEYVRIKNLMQKINDPDSDSDVESD